MTKLNVVFSTTRQWDPGDEFILAGIRNILHELNIEFNPIIFNRNPDIRSCFQDRQIFKTSRVPINFVLDPDFIDLEANIKFGFFDNSLKPDTDCNFVDWVILAGPPEWCSGKMADLYSCIRRYNLPVMIIGVGGNCEITKKAIERLSKKQKSSQPEKATRYKLFQIRDFQQ